MLPFRLSLDIDHVVELSSYPEAGIEKNPPVAANTLTMEFVKGCNLVQKCVERSEAVQKCDLSLDSQRGRDFLHSAGCFVIVVHYFGCWRT